MLFCCIKRKYHKNEYHITQPFTFYLLRFFLFSINKIIHYVKFSVWYVHLNISTLNLKKTLWCKMKYNRWLQTVIVNRILVHFKI